MNTNKNSMDRLSFDQNLLVKNLQAIQGQQDSMEIIARKVCTWVKRPDEKKTPLVFMLGGSSGTGKSFTVETVNETLGSYGYLFVKLSMNEYKNEGDTWKLLGSAVGYVGSEEDAPLFAARKESERLVILFDEMEKAHESIFETIMTLMEKGILTNGKGESFDFKQSIIFFTTNLAMNELLERKKELISAGEKLDSYTFQQSIKDILRNNHVNAEVCGRINTVLIYNTLTKETLARIALEEIREIGRVYSITINRVPQCYLEEIATKCKETSEGARPIKIEVWNKFESLFQEVYERETIDPRKMYDITEEYNIVLSQNDTLMKPEDISVVEKKEVDSKNELKEEIFSIMEKLQSDLKKLQLKTNELLINNKTL